QALNHPRHAARTTLDGGSHALVAVTPGHDQWCRRRPSWMPTLGAGLLPGNPYAPAFHVVDAVRSGRVAVACHGIRESGHVATIGIAGRRPDRLRREWWHLDRGQRRRQGPPAGGR